MLIATTGKNCFNLEFLNRDDAVLESIDGKYTERTFHKLAPII
ncbi:hypothetical protein [Microcoleus vaginatus]